MEFHDPAVFGKGVKYAGNTMADVLLYEGTHVQYCYKYAQQGVSKVIVVFLLYIKYLALGEKHSKLRHFRCKRHGNMHYMLTNQL